MEVIEGPANTEAEHLFANGRRPVQGRDVLAVIPVLNEASHIETCLRDLLAGDDRLADVLFVVADGGSTDGTPDLVRELMKVYPNLRLVENPARLQSAAVNLVARRFSEDRRVLVRCDAHALYPPGYVMTVADSLVRHGVESLVTPMDAIGQTCFQKANALIVDTPLGSGGSAHRGGRRSGFVDTGHHAGFDLRSFLEIGGYDETFSHNEDAEYDRRLRATSGRIFLDAEIRLQYFPRSGARALARQYYNYGRGRARTLLKHRDVPRARQMIPPFVLLVCCLSLAIAPLWPWSLSAPAGYVAALSCASIWGALKLGSLCGLFAGPASGIMHMAWAAGFFRQAALPGARSGRSAAGASSPASH
jgi:succinoglycan biosynthesis protein ExoA